MRKNPELLSPKPFAGFHGLWASGTENAERPNFQVLNLLQALMGSRFPGVRL